MRSYSNSLGEMKCAKSKIYEIEIDETALYGVHEDWGRKCDSRNGIKTENIEIGERMGERMGERFYT